MFDRGLLWDYRFLAQPVVCDPIRRKFEMLERGLSWESPILDPTSGWRANFSELCEV